MRKYYKNGYYMCGKRQRQHQIDNVLSVYDYIGKANRRKDLPKSVKNTEKTDNKQGGRA